MNPSELMDGGGGGGGPPNKKPKLGSANSATPSMNGGGAATLASQMSETSAEVSLIENLLPDELVTSETPTNSQPPINYYNRPSATNQPVAMPTQQSQSQNSGGPRVTQQRISPSLTINNVASVSINNINIMVQPNQNANSTGQGTGAPLQRYPSANQPQPTQINTTNIHPGMNVGPNNVMRINRGPAPSQPTQTINSNG